MPKPDKPAPIPDWLKPTLKRHISGEAQPDTYDFQVVSAALAGVELEALQKRFKSDAEEIQKSILRVACAVREERVSTEFFDEYPDLGALRQTRKRGKQVAIVKGPRSESDIETLAMDTSELPAIIPGDDQSFHDFLVAAKVQRARTLIPATLMALESNVKSPDGMVSNEAIAKALDLYYHLGKRGPGVAMQFNLGDKPSGEKAVDTPHFFEETILDAETAEGSRGGEVTHFDERLLGLQEEG